MINVKDNLTGKRFGRLIVLKQIEDYVSPKGDRKARWLCKCDCGNFHKATSVSLKKGYTKSCGCYRKENTGKMNNKRLKKYNTYIISDDGKYYTGYDENGNSFMFSSYHYNDIKDIYWSYQYKKKGYFSGRVGHKKIELQRYIMSLIQPIPDGYIVDHIDIGDCNTPHNLGDCRDENLRLVTMSQNNANQNVKSNSKLGVKGVYYFDARNKYVARITHNYVKYHLGCYDTLKEAADAYDKAALHFFGEYARLNNYKED